MREKWEQILLCDASRYLNFGLAMFLVGIIFIFLVIGDVIATSKTPSDFNMMTPSQCKAGAHVQGEISASLGYYWESATSRNGVKMNFSEERIYLIPYGYEGNRFIGINVDYSEFDKFEQLTYMTYAYLENSGSYPESIGTYEGYIKKCDARMKKMLAQQFSDNLQTLDADDYFMPYYIELHHSSSGLFAVVGLGFLLAGFVSVFMFFLPRYKDEVENTATGLHQYIGTVIYDASDTTATSPIYLGDSVGDLAALMLSTTLKDTSPPPESILHPQNPKPVNYGRTQKEDN